MVVSSAMIFLSANGLEMSKEELAQLTAEAEYYVGTQGGGMDQATCLLGRSGHALKIDFNPFAVTPTSMPEGYVIVVVNTMKVAPKTKAAMDNYNRRPIECRLAVPILKKCFDQALGRDVSIKLIGDLIGDRLGIPEQKVWEIADPCFHEASYTLGEIGKILGRDPGEIQKTYCKKRDGSLFKEPDDGFKLFQRYRHVTTEWKRVEKSLREFQANNMEAFGTLMDESHASCRDDYEISCPELDRLTSIAKENGALGSRLTGAGFGGCTVSLVKESHAQSFIDAIIQTYYRDFLKDEREDYSDSIFACKAVNGADVLF
jgi:N-acetylgalactosamine kinase